MRSVSFLLLLAVGLTGPEISYGQGQTSAPASIGALAEKEQRRLNFYAEKIVVELNALILASQNTDLAGFNKHGTAMKTTAERLLGTADGLGLSRDDAEQLFQAHLADSGSTPLPFFLADDAGNTDLGRILGLEVDTGAPQQSGQDYVNAIRDAGETLFGE